MYSALVWVPFCAYTVGFIIASLAISCRPKLKFEKNIKNTLVILFISCVLKQVNRFVLVELYENDYKDEGVLHLLDFFGLACIIVISVTASFILLKLNHLLYILPNKDFRWVLV